MYIQLVIVCFHPVVDVSAQGGCTITPISPTTLTAAGGVLAIGTENVTIRCNNCTDEDGAVVNTVRWYDPDGNRLVDPVTFNKDYVSGTPHFLRVNGANNDIMLVIPTFNDSYDGIYICGMKVRHYPPGPPNAAINLIINGEL